MATDSLLSRERSLRVVPLLRPCESQFTLPGEQSLGSEEIILSRNELRAHYHDIILGSAGAHKRGACVKCAEERILGGAARRAQALK